MESPTDTTTLPGSGPTSAETSTPAPSAPNLSSTTATTAAPGAPSAPAAPAPAPAVVKPVKRGGLAGIIDEFRDAIAGPAPGRIYEDADGNKFIKHEDSNGSKWSRIAGTAIRGAAAGAAAGQGPGGKFRAAEAGIEAGDKIAEQRKRNAQEQTEEVKNAQLEKFNNIKLKHDLAAQEFTLQRLKVKATDDDVKFSQEQIDRERALGSSDLGIYKDEADLARVKTAHPDFWKSVYENNIVTVPELDPSGERKGIHVFLRSPGIGTQLVDAGTPIKVFTPGKGPNDPPTLRDVVPTVPMTHDQKDAYDNAAMTKYQKWHSDQEETKLKDAQIERDKAQAAKDRADAAKTNADRASGAGAGLTGEEYLKTIPADRASIARLVGSGRMAPERMSYLLARKEGKELLSDVAIAFPDVDTSKLAAYPKAYQDFVSGKSAQTMQNLNTSFMHIDDLKRLNTYGSRLPGSNEEHAFNSKLTNASAEIANALAKPGASATKDEIEQVRKSLSPTFNRDAAINEQTRSLVQQYRSFRNKWVNAAPSAVFESQMPDLSPEAQRVIRKYAPEDANVWWGKPVIQNGVLLGYSKDGVHYTPAK